MATNTSHLTGDGATAVTKAGSPQRGGRPTASDLLGLLALVAVAVVFWEWNIIRAGETLVSLLNFDLYSEFFPRHHFAGETLRNGSLPLWDPHQIGGLPFLATYQGGVLYPPNLLFAVLPTGSAIGLLGMLHVIAAGVFTALLCREFGRSRSASWLAGLAFMFGGSTLFLIYQTNAIHSVPWLPAALYCCSRLARDGNLRWSILLAACIALQFLAGRDFTFVMTIHAVGLFVAFQVAWMLRDGSGLRPVGAYIARLAVGAAFAAGLVAAQALPTLALAADSGRTMAGLDGKFLEIYDPMSPAFFLANLVNPDRGGIRREYFGWIPLLCFVLGFRLWGRDRPTVFASLLSLLTLLLCFGSLTPLYDAYRALPLGSTFRLPDRFLYLFSLGFVLVAAAGLDRLRAARGDWRARVRLLAPRFAVVLMFGIALFVALDSQWFEAGLAKSARPWKWFAYYGLPQEQFAAIDRSIVYFAAGATLLISFALRVHSRGGRALQVAILLVATADLGFAVRNSFIHPAHDPTPAVSGAACYERAAAIAGDYGRHLSFRLPNSHALKDKDGELFSLFSATHYDPLVTLRQAGYFAALEEGSTRFIQSPWSERSAFMGFLSGTPARERRVLLDLLGTRVILADARKPFRPAGLDDLLGDFERAGRCRVDTDDGAIPVDLYSNPQATPRAYVVHRVHSAAGPDAAIQRVLRPGFDPRREAVVEGTAPSFAASTGNNRDHVEITSYEPTRVVVRVDAGEPGLLVLGDSYDDDWIATLNDAVVPVLPTNGLFRGVAIPAGRSELTFRYRPRHFHWGAAISVLTIALAAMLWFRAPSTTRHRIDCYNADG
jgi:hypothetical protein